VWGGDDHIIPVEHALVAHEAIPGSRLAVLPGVGHFPHIEAPDAFIATLRDFLASTTPGQVQRDHHARVTSMRHHQRRLGSTGSGNAKRPSSA